MCERLPTRWQTFPTPGKQANLRNIRNLRNLIIKELLWRVLTQKRWELLKALCGAGPVSIREAARRAERDVKAVHGDVTALLNAGVLDRTEDGRIVFPFEAVKVEFLLQAA